MFYFIFDFINEIEVERFDRYEEEEKIIKTTGRCSKNNTNYSISKFTFT